MVEGTQLMNNQERARAIGMIQAAVPTERYVLVMKKCIYNDFTLIYVYITWITYLSKIIKIIHDKYDSNLPLLSNKTCPNHMPT